MQQQQQARYKTQQQRLLSRREEVLLTLLGILLTITTPIASGTTGIKDETALLLSRLGVLLGGSIIIGFAIELLNRRLSRIEARQDAAFLLLEHMYYETLNRDNTAAETLDRIEQQGANIHFGLNRFATTGVKKDLQKEDTNGHYHTLPGTTSPRLEAFTVPAATPHTAKGSRRSAGGRGGRYTPAAAGSGGDTAASATHISPSSSSPAGTTAGGEPTSSPVSLD